MEMLRIWKGYFEVKEISSCTRYGSILMEVRESSVMSFVASDYTLFRLLWGEICFLISREKYKLYKAFLIYRSENRCRRVTTVPQYCSKRTFF